MLINALPIRANFASGELQKLMHTYKVPVVGYAIIDNYKIIEAKTISINTNIKVSKDSIFQAASISKTLTSYGALTLVDKGKLNLESDINIYLKDWKIKPNPFNRDNPIKISNLMDMTSGLSVSGFAGYDKSKVKPSLTNILNGTPPANNDAISVFYKSGSKYFYSGGAFQVLEKVISDVTGKNFNTFMNDEVLAPIGMTNSIYQYPLKEKEFLTKVVPGYEGFSGQKIKGGWLNYFCSGAGGMWSTPTDLAKFSLNLTDAYLGKKAGLISKALATKALTRRVNTDFGLGVVVSGKKENLYFWKAGHNYGYHSIILMFPNKGKGIAIMTNSESGGLILDYMIAVTAKRYHWPYYFPFFDELIVLPDF